MDGRPRGGSGAANPNVVMIVFDDLGFADLGCFGSSIATPAVDELAAQGLRYNNFHVTSICSATRACLLTGRNHHAVGMGSLTNFASEAPGYTGRIPKSTPTLPRMLRDAGYNTFAVGKWHLSPPPENGAAGPFDLWPLGLGFERYYGFLDGLTNQWTPRLVRDNGVIEQPFSPEEGYHVSEDLASQAIRLVQDQKQDAPEKPFFLYFALGAPHAPHHVWSDWVEPYRGMFDDGWEVARELTFRRQQELGVVPAGTTLTERPPWVSGWDDLTADERRLCARQMEVYAGFLAHADAQIGRLMAFLERLGILDDTIVVVTSDNGASAEGGPLGEFSVAERAAAGDPDAVAEGVKQIDALGGFRAMNHYAWGWAWAGNTPFRLWKRYAWLGGVRVPLVVRWGSRVAGADGGQVRTQFGHAVDLMPSLLDATGVGLDGIPDGQSLDGRTLVATFDDAEHPSPRSTQYFEMLGSRAIYREGWKATTNHVSSFLGAERVLEGSRDFERDQWSLFCLDDDFSEAHDLAEHAPDQLRRMIETWWHEAGRNQVLPLTDAPAATLTPSAGPQKRVWLPGGGPIASPPLISGFRLVADIEVADGRDASGIICAQGDWTGGWACYVLDGCVVATMQIAGEPQRIRAREPLGAGRHEVALEYLPDMDPEASFRLSVDGAAVGARRIPPDQWRWIALFLGAYGPLFVGRDEGFPVCDDYRAPFAFTARIHQVAFESPAGSGIANGSDALDEALRRD